MKIVDGVVYAQAENSDLRVIDVEILKDLCLIIEFSNGEKRIFDASKLLEYPVYEKLKDNKIFKSVDVKNGVLVWDEENVDVGVDFLYANSKEYIQE